MHKNIRLTLLSVALFSAVPYVFAGQATGTVTHTKTHKTVHHTAHTKHATASKKAEAKKTVHHASHKVTRTTAHHATARAKPVSHAVAASQPQIASGSAMVVDLADGKVLYASHPDKVRPIASLTKLMTAMVVLDAHQPMNDMLSVDISHTPEMRGVFSRVKLNSEISRRNMLLLALMSSEKPCRSKSCRALPGWIRCFYSRHECQSAGIRYDPHTLCRADRVIAEQRVNRTGSVQAGDGKPPVPTDW